MKQLELKCCRCGEKAVVFGYSADEICKAIDALGWHDEPDEYHCPACWAIELDEESEKS